MGFSMGTVKRRAVLGTDSGCLDHMQVQGVDLSTLQSGVISDSINPSRGCFLSLFYKKPCLFFQNCLILPRFGVFPDNACPEICLFMSLYAAEREGRCDLGCGWGWGKEGLFWGVVVGDIGGGERNPRGPGEGGPGIRETVPVFWIYEGLVGTGRCM